VIVVIGSVALELDPGGGGRVVGLAGGAAFEAVAAGSSVELLAKVGEDGAGEELLIALARGGVGHLAVLRDPAGPTAVVAAPPEAALEDGDVALGRLMAEPVTVESGSEEPTRAPEPGVPPEPGLVLEPADLALGLRYLRDYRVVVVVEPLADGCAAVVADAASFLDAPLVVVAAPGRALPDAYAVATVLEAPAEDPEGAFAALVGRFAAALDRGEPVADALRMAAAAGGWEPAGD
jgi:hypothetical protein